jgi:hypothetical protein
MEIDKVCEGERDRLGRKDVVEGDIKRGARA